MAKKRFHISPNGRTPDRSESDKSIEWLEQSYRIDEAFGRIECPVCHSRNLTILDIQCPNCKVFVAKNRHPIDKDGEARLAGGLKASELMDRSRRWWNKNGRLYFKRIRNRPGDSIARTPELQQRGIMMGKKFEELTRAEKFAVCKAYHQSWYEAEHTGNKPVVATIVI